MAYLVLARKWRPQTLEDVLGQEHVTTTLRNAIAGDRVAHAYLFTGARGVGKTSSARILAKALNCVNGPTVNPCNECENCREITEGNSLDVFEIDAASNTGVDHVRDLQEGLRYMPNKSRFKIYIIDEVHMLSTAAFNALLKTLEEPPAHVRFIFATTEPHKIPVTILSRCQRFDFKRISRGGIVERLSRILSAENVEFDEESLALIAREAEGSMRDSLSLTDQALSFGGGRLDVQTVISALGIIDRDILGQAVSGILHGDAQGLLEIVDRIYDYGYDVRQFTKNLLEHFRNLLVVRVASDPSRLVDLPAEDLADMKAMVDEQTVDRLHRLFSALLKLGEDVARSAHPRMVLEVGLVRLATLGPLQPVEELIGKIRDLANRPPPIAGGVGTAAPVGHGAPSHAAPPPPMSRDIPPPPPRPVPSRPNVDAGAPREGGPRQPARDAREQRQPAKGGDDDGDLPPAGAGESFMAYLRRVNRRLAAMLNSIQVEEKSGGVIVRVPANQTFLMPMLQNGGPSKELQAAADAFLGAKASVTITTGAHVAAAEAPESEKKQRVQEQQNVGRRKQEAVDHPLVDAVFKVFGGGSIVEVHMLTEALPTQNDSIEE